MRTIYKYKLSPYAPIQTHEDAKVLSVGAQNDEPYVWLEIDTDKPLVDKHFLIVGTGHHIHTDYKGEFVGTVHLFSGKLVLYIYEDE